MVTLQNIRIVNHLMRELVHIALIADRNPYKRGDIFTDLFAIQESLITPNYAAGF